MIEYEPGYWGLAFACRVRGSVIPKTLVWAIPVSLLAVAFHVWLKGESGQPSETIQARENDLDGSMSAMSLVLGFLVVFRTQKAYDRWWEAAKLLQQVRGCWFNAFSNLIAFGNQAPENREKLDAFGHQLVRLFSLLYGNALLQCSTREGEVLEFIDFTGIEEDSLEYLVRAHDPCEVVLQWIQRTIVCATDDNVIKIAPPILSRVYNQLGNGIVSLNGARQIKQFPIPFLLAQMLIVLMLFRSMVTPLFLALKLESSGMVFLATFVCEICFWGIHYIAEELEGPYGGDANDLPLQQLQVDLNRSLASLMHHKARAAPAFHFKPEADPLFARKTIDLKQYLMHETGHCVDTISALGDVSVSGEGGGTKCDSGDPLTYGASQQEVAHTHVLYPVACGHDAQKAAPAKAHKQSSCAGGPFEGSGSQIQGSIAGSLDAPGRQQLDAGGKAGDESCSLPRRLDSAKKDIVPAVAGGGGELRGAKRSESARKLVERTGTQSTQFCDSLMVSFNSDLSVVQSAQLSDSLFASVKPDLSDAQAAIIRDGGSKIQSIAL